MAVKQSALEKRWYYRLAKVVLCAVPFIAVAFYFYSHQGAFPEIVSLFNKSDFLSLAKNYGPYFGFWLVGYPVILTFGWQIIAYLVFGGIDHEPAKKPAQNRAGKSEVSGNNGLGALLLIIVIVLVLVYFSRNSGQAMRSTGGGTKGKTGNTVGSTGNNSGSTNSTGKCVPTGCGSMWRCSGSYYVDGTRVSANGGCFPSGIKSSEIFSNWSGTYRLCP